MASGRRRRGGRGSSRAPPPARAPSSPSQEPPPFLLPGGEVEVRVDGGGCYGTWYRGTVREFIPAGGRRSVPRATVVYYDLIDDGGGGPVEETFALSHIRPRPPPPDSSPLRRFDIVEAFDTGGWWSGIVMAVAASSVSVAFPITRDVIQFDDPGLVRPRRDYIGGEWLPSQSVVALQPKCPVRLYQVDDKVEVVRTTHDGDCSWFPATVVKVVDSWSYIVEYIDQEEANPEEKAIEYLHWKFIRPAVDHSPPDSKFCFKPGAAVEAYCDGSWSPGVVHRVIGEGEYEIKLNGKGRKLVTKLLELLKPHYKWDGNDWKIVGVPKRHTKLRLQSASGKRQISHSKVISGDGEHCHDPEYPSIKKSRKGLPHQEQAVILTDVSEHSLISEMDKAPASNDSLNFCSQLSGHTARSKESVTNVDKTDRNHEILCNMVHSENERVETHPMQALLGQYDVPDKLMEKNSIPNTETSRALCVSSKCQTILMPSKQELAGTNSCPTMKVYAKKTSSKKKCLKVPNGSGSSIDEKSAKLVELSSLVVDVIESQTQQQLHKTLEDTLSTDKVINQELNIQGTDIHDSLLEESTATVVSSRRSNRNVAMPTDRALTQVVKSNHHTEIYVRSVEHVQHDGDKMEERSECTISNTLLKSCSVAGSRTLSHLTPCQSTDYELPFVKESPMWSLAEEMDVFKELPQRPHFRALQKSPLELREAMAIGLMSTFATLVEKVKKSSIRDTMASFEKNINALDYLEENGFSVQSLRSSLNQLLTIKSSYEKNLKEKEELNAQMLNKVTSLSQINLMLDENEKAIEELHCKRKEIAMKKEHENAQLSKLKAADSGTEKACGIAECEFRSVLTELQRKPLT